MSPAEPKPFWKLGTVSRVTEQYGADFIVISPVFKRVGIQRKTIEDLIASLHGDRVERELLQQKRLDQAIWLLEGTPRWTNDGHLLSAETRSRFTRAHLTGVILSLFSNGSWILNSSSLTDSIELLSLLNRWLTKEKHGTLLRRPARSSQLPADVKDKQIHVMQGFDGVGYEKAKDIIEYCGGLPFELTYDIMDVPGIGKKIDREIRTVLGGE